MHAEVVRYQAPLNDFRLVYSTGSSFAHSTANSDGAERGFATPEASPGSPNEISTNKYKKLPEIHRVTHANE